VLDEHPDLANQFFEVQWLIEDLSHVHDIFDKMDAPTELPLGDEAPIVFRATWAEEELNVLREWTRAD